MANFSRPNSLSRILFLLISAHAIGSAATFAVNSVDDEVDSTPGDGICDTRTGASGTLKCTLRAALMEANALSGPQTVTVPAGTYILRVFTPCAYASNGSSETFSSLCITGNITLNGAGPGRTIIDANTPALFNPNSGDYNRSSGIVIGRTATTSISGLQIVNGFGLGGVTEAFGGAAILNNFGTVRLSNLMLTNHDGTGRGVLGNKGSMWMESVTVAINSSSNTLGTVRNVGGIATLFINNSNISGNGGGGVDTGSGKVYITNSTISGNSGFGVSANYNRGDPNYTSITNTTVSGNIASGPGGGILSNINGGLLELNNVTVAYNRSANGVAGVSASLVNIRNSIIAKNTGAYTQFIGPSIPGEYNCASQNTRWTSQGYNIIGTANDCGPIFTGGPSSDRLGIDPLLTPLGTNGGPTQTHALTAASPAVNSGNPATTGSAACAATDQRGVLRPQGARCDIGAFERDLGFSVSGVTPGQGGRSGTSFVAVSGGGFLPGASAALRRSGQPDIPLTRINLDAGGASAFGGLDLSNAALGVYDLAFTNGDGATALLPAVFTVLAPVAPQIYSSVLGRSAIRRGLPASFQIVVGNRGNVEARNIALTLSVPGNFELSLDSAVNGPPPQAGQVTAVDPALFPLAVLPYSRSASLNVPLLIPIVPGNSSVTYGFSLLLPSAETHGNTFSFLAAPGSPLSNPNNDPAVLQQMVDGAVAYASVNFGVTVPTSSLAAIQTYAAGQLDRALAQGREQLIATAGAFPSIYSLGQLAIDLGRYAASISGVGQSAFGGAERTRDIALRVIPRQSPGPTPIPVKSFDGKCKGQVLAEGQSCKDDPAPVPPPDPNKPDKRGIRPGACTSLPNHHISNDGTQCLPDDARGCPLMPNPMLGADPNCLRLPILNSVDPNEKSGPLGGGTSNARRSGGAYSYQISFENLATASAAAQIVTVGDQIDTSRLDLDTLSLGPLGFGDITVVPPPGLTSYRKVLDMRPAGNYLVQMTAALDKSTGIVTWVFRTLDPLTGQATTDPILGFLPPNRNGKEGSGFVGINVTPRYPAATGTAICNQAIIVFDTNAPIVTNRYCNTLDDTAPTSRVTALPAQQSTNTFPVLWDGSDAGSSIAYFDVYVSEQGAPYKIWQSTSAAKQANYTGEAGKRYSFFSLATDLAGNAEGSKSAAEATTSVQSAAVCAANVNSQFSIVPGGFRLNNATGRFQQVVTIKRTAAGNLAGPFALAFSALSSNATVFQPSGTTSCTGTTSPYILVPINTTWAPGQSISVTVDFVNPARTAISWTPLLFAGSNY